MACFQEVSGSNVCLDFGCHARFSQCSSVRLGICQHDGLGRDRFLSYLFQFVIHFLDRQYCIYSFVFYSTVKYPYAKQCSLCIIQTKYIAEGLLQSATTTYQLSVLRNRGRRTFRGWCLVVPAEYGLFHFLEKRFFSSLGFRARSASYSVSISRSFPRGKRPVGEANHSYLVPRLRTNEAIGLRVSASAYAFMVCALGYFFYFSSITLQVLPLAHVIFSFTSNIHSF